MATRAKQPANDGPEVVGQIVLLPVDSIELGTRLRPVDRLAAEGIGHAMKAMGQKKPIEVCRLPGRNHWTVVDGAHRVTGAKAVGIVYLRAEVVENDPQIRLEREISAGLFNADLAPLDRAAFVGKLIELERQRAGITPDQSAQSIAAQARWKDALKSDASDACDIVSHAYRLSAEIGDRLNLSHRTIERDLLLYRRIPATLIARLREVDHSALRSSGQLLALAKLDEDQQVAAIDRLLWEETGSERRKPMTLQEAIAAGLDKNKGAKAPGDKHLSAFVGSFGRMSLGEKKGALNTLQGMLPAGYKLTYGEQMAVTARGFSAQHEKYREDALAAIDAARGALLALLEDADGASPVMIDSERWEELHKAQTGLQLTRFSISADAFELGEEA